MLFLERLSVRSGVIEVNKWKLLMNMGNMNEILNISISDQTRNVGFRLEKYRFKKDKSKPFLD